MDRVYVMQLVRSFQVGGMSRREFLRRATIALGSVAAAQMLLTGAMVPNAEARPVVSEPGLDDAPRRVVGPDGVVSERIEYQDAQGNPLSGYLARPASAGPFPAVVVIQEWWGIDNHIKDLTLRFARQGYAAFAPDLYHGVAVSEPDEARKLVMELDREAAVGEIRAAISMLLGESFVASDKVGIIGFCMGGGLVLRTSLVEPNVGAAIAFYGAPLEAKDVSQVKAPILGLYGAEDQGIPVEGIKMMQDALNQAGIENEIQIYEGAGHAFFNDARASGFNKAAAEDAWTRTLAWFKKHLSPEAVPQATTTA